MAFWKLLRRWRLAHGVRFDVVTLVVAIGRWALARRGVEEAMGLDVVAVALALVASVLASARLRLTSVSSFGPHPLAERLRPTRRWTCTKSSLLLYENSRAAAILLRAAAATGVERGVCRRLFQSCAAARRAELGALDHRVLGVHRRPLALRLRGRRGGGGRRGRSHPRLALGRRRAVCGPARRPLSATSRALPRQRRAHGFDPRGGRGRAARRPCRRDLRA